MPSDIELRDSHDSIDEIPEPYRELYTEKNGKFELTGIKGIKTQADVDRLTNYLQTERKLHAETKDRLAIWGDLDHEDVVSKLDRFPELEAAAKGNLNEAQIEEAVNRRVEGTLRTRMAPVERKHNALEKEVDELRKENAEFRAEKIEAKIHKKLLQAAGEAKVLESAREDILEYANRFEVTEDGEVVTRDLPGVNPGVDPMGWITEMQDRRPHWWPAAQGAGARGGSGAGGAMGADNPWSRDGWNKTKQGQYIRQHGRDRAEQIAKAVGSSLEAFAPPKPKGK